MVLKISTVTLAVYGDTLSMDLFNVDETHSTKLNNFIQVSSKFIEILIENFF